MGGEFVSIKDMNIPWRKPTDLGIQWYKEQRLPEPHREITFDQFLPRFFGHGYTLEGVAYDQLFLDWGKGPLAKNPETRWTKLSNIFYDPQPGAVVNVRKHMSGILVGVRKAGYATTLAEVMGETGHIAEYPAYEVEIKSIYSGYGGWIGLQNHWSVQYYWYFDIGFAVAERYMYKRDLDKVVEHESFVRGLGKFFLEDEHSDSGRFLRFFEIGCKHEMLEYSKQYCDKLDRINAQLKTPKSKDPIRHMGMFDHYTVCKKCGHIHRYDSSG